MPTGKKEYQRSLQKSSEVEQELRYLHSQLDEASDSKTGEAVSN